MSLGSPAGSSSCLSLVRLAIDGMACSDYHRLLGTYALVHSQNRYGRFPPNGEKTICRALKSQSSMSLCSGMAVLVDSHKRGPFTRTDLAALAWTMEVDEDGSEEFSEQMIQEIFVRLRGLEFVEDKEDGICLDLDQRECISRFLAFECDWTSSQIDNRFKGLYRPNHEGN